VVTHGGHVVSSTMRPGDDGAVDVKLRIVAAGMEMGGQGGATTFRYGLTNLRAIPGNDWKTDTTPMVRQEGCAASFYSSANSMY
jgi:hypothetical protein